MKKVPIGFKESEFLCRCKTCGKGFASMQESTLAKLEKAREVARIIQPGTVFIISSAMRYGQRNKSEGGSAASSHLTGFAVDIRITSSAQAYAIIFGLLTAGFTRIGISKTFIHTDDDPDKTPQVIWQY